MPARESIDLLLRILDQAYDRPAWHGPNLTRALHGVSAAAAARRPGPGRHNIAEIAAHCAYWKHVVRGRLTGDRAARFPLAGRNWFEIAKLGDARWRELRSLLEATHVALRDAIAALDPARLDRPAAGSRQLSSVLAYGIASHDLYHAGQIQLLKRMLPAR